MIGTLGPFHLDAGVVDAQPASAASRCSTVPIAHAVAAQRRVHVGVDHEFRERRDLHAVTREEDAAVHRRGGKVKLTFAPVCETDADRDARCLNVL